MNLPVYKEYAARPAAPCFQESYMVIQCGYTDIEHCYQTSSTVCVEKPTEDSLISFLGKITESGHSTHVNMNK